MQDILDSDFDTESSDEEREQEELGREADKAIEKQERQVYIYMEYTVKKERKKERKRKLD